MTTMYRHLIRIKRAKGFLDRDEQRALREARLDEFTRRYNALYGAGLFVRRLAQLGCAIREALKPH